MLAGSPLAARRGDEPAFPGERLVVVSSPFFPHRLSETYWSPVGWVVSSVNGIPVRNLAHLVTILRDSKDEFAILDFVGRGMETFAFPRSETIAATDEILNDNGVRNQGSADMMLIWRKKAGEN